MFETESTDTTRCCVAVHARRQLQGCSRISCEVPSGVRRVLPRCRVLVVANVISLAKWIKPREASSAAGLALQAGMASWSGGAATPMVENRLRHGEARREFSFVLLCCASQR